MTVNHSLYEQGVALLEQGAYEQAEQCFRAAIEAEPGNAQAWNKLGVLYVHRRDLKQALACFQTAVGCDPKLAAAYSNLGNIYLEQGDLDNAQAAYHRAIEADPECAVAYHNLGVLYKQQGNYGEGIKYLKKAAKLNRNRPWQGRQPPRLESVRVIIWLIIIGLVLFILLKRQ